MVVFLLIGDLFVRLRPAPLNGERRCVCGFSLGLSDGVGPGPRQRHGLLAGSYRLRSPEVVAGRPPSLARCGATGTGEWT